MPDLELPEVIRILIEGPCIATPEIRISPMPLLSFCQLFIVFHFLTYFPMSCVFTNLAGKKMI